MGWRLTATTLFCETIKKWVPIIVYKDGRAQCGYYHRHAVVLKDVRHLCQGPEGCSLCSAYKEDVLHREEPIAQTPEDVRSDGNAVSERTER